MSTPKPQVRILFVGDMHLGVLPSGLAKGLTEIHQIQPNDLSPATAWFRVVDTAIEHQVHAVALAGDLVQGDNALFEAFGPLESGLRRLAKANIPVVAVAGNHDTDALPRLAGITDSLHILGPEGSWSSHVVTGDDGLEVRLTGWSFPRPHVETSPLQSPIPSADSQRATFGLLHADLDQAQSQYAPVSSRELLAVGYRAWFLGHIHLPGIPTDNGQPFYLGSLSGLHPGETGEHGPLLVTLETHEKMTLQRLPVAPLRWEKLEIPCEDFHGERDDLSLMLLTHLSKYAEGLGSALEQVRVLGFRVVLTGALENPAGLRRDLEKIYQDPEHLITTCSETVLFINKITDETTLKVDLFAIARTTSPEGLLARRILVLEGEPKDIPGVDDPASLRESLLIGAEEALTQVDRQNSFLFFEDRLGTSETALLLARSGRKILEEILNRKEEGHEAE